jgi:TrmH family RNA methyltransferase
MNKLNKRKKMLSKNQVKYIQSLGHKKCRDEEGLFIAEGPKIAAELLTVKNCVVKQVYAVKDWINEKAIKKATAIIEVTADELERISQLTTANQVLLVAEKLKWDGGPEIQNKVSLALNTIQDPGNMGTIIRLADWFGIKQITCSYDCVDVYNPKVVQASMGSFARVRVDYTDLAGWLKKNKEVPTYAAVLDGKDITRMEKLTEGIIIIGNESKGISEEILNEVNTRITIPGKGSAESLNAAVATGIILSHLCASPF